MFTPNESYAVNVLLCDGAHSNGESIEEVVRQRVRDLMADVQNAEKRADAAGMTLRDRDGWLSVLNEGQDPVGEGQGPVSE